jgi:predicted transposase/invertase (TIGR01784 family)
MEKVMAEDSVLSMAKDIELSFWADEKERESYFKHQKYLMDLYSDEHTYEVLLRQEREKAEREKEKAAQNALKQGLEQGLEQGKREMAFAMVRNFLKLGTGMDIIVQASGLSEEEIRRISE